MGAVRDKCGEQDLSTSSDAGVRVCAIRTSVISGMAESDLNKIVLDCLALSAQGTRTGETVISTMQRLSVELKWVADALLDLREGELTEDAMVRVSKKNLRTVE